MPQLTTIMGLCVALCFLLVAPPAKAQNTGFSYFNNSEDQVNQLKGQVEQSRQGLVNLQEQEIQAAMRDPQVWAMYQQNNLGLSYHDFAYQYLQTAGFTNSQAARQSRDLNTANMARTFQGEQQSEQQRSNAQQGMQSDLSNLRVEEGNLLEGQSTWIGSNGETYVLPQIQPNVPWQDQNSGRYFSMDAQGNYYTYTQDDTWQPLAPAH
jgi:hypothetical protein